MPGCAEPTETSTEHFEITNDGLVACGSGIYDLSQDTYQSIFSSSNCQVIGLNDFGKAIANCGIDSGSCTALVIDLKTGVQTLLGTELGDPNICVTSISDSDIVVGDAFCGKTIAPAFAYDVSGVIPVKVSLGGYDSLPVLAAAVSEHGIVAISVQPASTAGPSHNRIGTYNLATSTAGAYDDIQNMIILSAVNDSGQATGLTAAYPPPSGGETLNAFYGKLPIA